MYAKAASAFSTSTGFKEGGAVAFIADVMVTSGKGKLTMTVVAYFYWCCQVL